MEDTTVNEAEEIKKKVDELASILYQGNHNADRMTSPSESQARADELMQRAIDIIEDLTGQKWNFTYITWL